MNARSPRSTRLFAAALALTLAACATGPHVDRSHVSENQDSRSQVLVLHYTVLDFDKALKVLTTGGQVSAHYLVRDNPAEIYGLVDELKMVERQRAFSRQLFNQAVGGYNEAVQQFPTRVLTSFFGFSEARSL